MSDKIMNKLEVIKGKFEEIEQKMSSSEMSPEEMEEAIKEASRAIEVLQKMHQKLISEVAVAEGDIKGGGQMMA